MYNDFVVIGPRSDPAGIEGAESPAEALKRIAAGRHTFISRGDASGTHIREQELWRETEMPLERERATVFAGGKERVFESVRPAGAWYVSVGQGMGKTIVVATERRAYTLADRGTYYAFALADPARTDLAILCEGHESLRNPYGVMAVNPEKHAGVNVEGAKRYIEWITSPEVQAMIGEHQVGGKVLFHPSAGSGPRE
jgi:tungstate transport system substrate-binding protein